MKTYRIGDWRLDLGAGWIEPDRLISCERIYPDARLMAVLVVLVENAGSVVSTDDLLAKAWPDRVVGRDSLATAIYGLRKLLRDDAASPSYIRTEARRGYRLIAPVSTIRQRSSWVRISSQRVAASAAIVLGGVFVAMALDPAPLPDGSNQYSDSANLYSAPGREHSLDQCPDKRNRKLVATAPKG